MRAFSVRPNEAELIITGQQTIENRSWVPREIGRVAVHATAPTHALVGTVVIERVVGYEEARNEYPDLYADIKGPWCWILRSPQRFPHPVPCRGRLHMWEVKGIKDRG